MIGSSLTYLELRTHLDCVAVALKEFRGQLCRNLGSRRQLRAFCCGRRLRYSYRVFLEIPSRSQISRIDLSFASYSS